MAWEKSLRNILILVDTKNSKDGWNEKVKNPRTNEYYQAEKLVKRELVPGDWKPPRTKNGKAVKYPFKEVWEIYRIRAVDSSEWLKFRYMMDWIGLETKSSKALLEKVY